MPRLKRSRRFAKYASRHLRGSTFSRPAHDYINLGGDQLVGTLGIIGVGLPTPPKWLYCDDRRIPIADYPDMPTVTNPTPDTFNDLCYSTTFSSFFGIDSLGSVWKSVTGAVGTWSRIDNTPFPEHGANQYSIEATEDAVYVVGHKIIDDQQTICMMKAIDGEVFEEVELPELDGTLYQIKIVNSILTAVGGDNSSQGYIFTYDPEEEEWTQVDVDADIAAAFGDIAFGNGKYALVGTDPDGDGAIYANAALDSIAFIAAIANPAAITFFNSLFVIGAQAGLIKTASDPTGSWTSRTSNTTENIWSFSTDGTVLIAVGVDIVRSTNGTAWTATVAAANCIASAYGATPDKFIACSLNGQTMKLSSDGITWSSIAQVIEHYRTPDAEEVADDHILMVKVIG
jgi:hypothetical protein